MAIPIDINNLTNGAEVQVSDGYEWQGTGIFDVVMKAVNGNIKTEYDNGRITGAEYATVYLGALQSAIAESVKILLNQDMVERQVASEEAKKLLIERQTKGFDDDAKQKLLKQALDSWSVAYSVAQTENAVPDTIKVDPIDSVFKDALDSLSVAVSTNPLGQA